MQRANVPPPSPRQFLPHQAAALMLLNAPTFLAETARVCGPIASFRIGAQLIVLVTDIEAIRDVLVDRDGAFHKASGTGRIRVTLGEGLLTSNGPLHRAQRASILPMFRSPELPRFEEAITRYSRAAAADRREGAPFAIDELMRDITLRAILDALFGPEAETEAFEIGAAFAAMNPPVPLAWLPLLDSLYHRNPARATTRFGMALSRLDAAVDRLVANVRPDSSAFIALQHLKGSRHLHVKRAGTQLRDEVVTLLLAGHETTANALTWCWYLLAQHPTVRHRLHAEVDEVTQGQAPALCHLPRLPFTRAVFTETLRLYPPDWITTRQAACSVSLGPYRVPAGTVVLLSQWLSHRSSANFPEPDTFAPSRWTDSSRDGARCPSFFAFGVGERRCVGQSFASAEAVLALATIAQHWRLDLANRRRVKPLFGITLRPARSIQMVPHRRHVSA